MTVADRSIWPDSRAGSSDCSTANRGTRVSRLGLRTRSCPSWIIPMT